MLARVRAIIGLIAILLIVREGWRASYVWRISEPAGDLARTRGALQIPGNIERFLSDVRGAVPHGSSVVVLLPTQPSIDDFPNSLTRRAMYILAGRRVEQYQPGEKLTADFLIALDTPITVGGYREILSREGGVLAERIH